MNELQTRLQAIIDEAGELNALGTLTQEQLTRVDELVAEDEALRVQIKAQESLGAVMSNTGQALRRAQPQQPDNPPAGEITGGAPVMAPNAGFANWGDFGQALVRAANVGPREADARFAQLAEMARMQGAAEYSGPEGGYLVPTDMAGQVTSTIMGEDSLVPRTDNFPTQSNAMEFPVDENAPWGSTGVQSYWTKEGAQATASNLDLGARLLRLEKLITYVPVTNEILSDTTLLNSFLSRKMPESARGKVNKSLIRGDGAGECMGILNSSAKVTVSKEGSQPAGSILGVNCLKMYARMPAQYIPSSVWMINQDSFPGLGQMFIPVTNAAGTENVGGWPVYVPANGLAGAPYGTILGQPVIPSEYCSTLGTEGDIIFTSWQAYLTLTKTNPTGIDVSIHVEFDKDKSAFRLVTRIYGAPWWSRPLTRDQGSNTLSTIVTLETRA